MVQCGGHRWTSMKSVKSRSSSNSQGWVAFSGSGSAASLLITMELNTGGAHIVGGEDADVVARNHHFLPCSSVSLLQLRPIWVFADSVALLHLGKCCCFQSLPSFTSDLSTWKDETSERRPSPIKRVNSRCLASPTPWLSMKHIYCFFFSHYWQHRQHWVSSVVATASLLHVSAAYILPCLQITITNITMVNITTLPCPLRKM